MMEIPAEVTTVFIAVCLSWVFGSSAIERAERKRPASRLEPERKSSSGGGFFVFGLVIAGIYFLTS